MTTGQTIAALRAKRQLIVARWAAELGPDFESTAEMRRYLLAADRMMRLTCAIDHALINLGVTGISGS